MRKDAKLAQKLGQPQPFIAVFPQECMGHSNFHLLGGTADWASLTPFLAQSVLGAAMAAGFLRCDAELRSSMAAGDRSGTTLVCCFLTPSHIVCANAGDAGHGAALPLWQNMTGSGSKITVRIPKEWQPVAANGGVE